jgi:hypothetical protein
LSHILKYHPFISNLITTKSCWPSAHYSNSNWVFE